MKVFKNGEKFFKWVRFFIMKREYLQKYSWTLNPRKFYEILRIFGWNNIIGIFKNILGIFREYSYEESRGSFRVVQEIL